jgi:beta-N-acetylhexosaminidase
LDWRGCLEVVGTVPRLERPLVLECRPPAGVASGDLPWSLADPLARRLPGTEHADVRERGEGAQAIEEAAGRPVVLVVRDPLRHSWQLDLLPFAAVIVDAGWPADLPTSAPVIRTRGIAPALLDAAAEVLAEG